MNEIESRPASPSETGTYVRIADDVIELDDNYPLADQPVGAKIMLKRHQLTLLRKCTDLETKRIPVYNQRGDMHSFMQSKIGIIGDKVGSGKSFVMLSLVLQSRELEATERKERQVVKSYGSNLLTLMDVQVKDSVKTNVLVIPHNLCAQWTEYVSRFCPQIKYAVINKSKTFCTMLDEDIGQYDLIIITCTYYNRFAAYLRQKELKMRRVMFDEVDSINITSCENMDADFYWFVTASYNNLIHPRGHSRYDRTCQRYIVTAVGLRKTGFIKEVFVDLVQANTSLVQMLVVRNSDAYISRSIELPEMMTRYIKCRTPITIYLLNGIVDRNVIESLNAGDVESAIQYISPQQRRSEDNIISLLIDKFEKQLMNINTSMQFVNRYMYDSDEERQQEVTRLAKRKQEVEERIENIKRRIHEGETCCICYDTIDKKTIVTCCSNAFCFKCLNLWLSRHNSCPLCKQGLTKESLFVVSDEANGGAGTSTDMQIDMSDELHESNDKIRNLRNLLKSLDANAKVLIFSAYDNTFIQVANALNELNIQYAFLKGNNFQIRNTVENYKNGALKVLMVNTMYYGSGLNLENTTDIIMFHKFNTECEKQVIGRAQRYGRTTPLNIWYLLHENEIDAANTTSV